MAYRYKSTSMRLLADTLTPVGVYATLREHFSQTLLLENKNQYGKGSDYAYICLEPVAGIVVSGNCIEEILPCGTTETFYYDAAENVMPEVTRFIRQFSAVAIPPFAVNGMFGYFSYEALQYFEDITLSAEKNEAKSIPDVQFHFYRYILAFDLLKQELYLIEFFLEDELPVGFEVLESLLQRPATTRYPFHLKGEESSNFTNASFTETVVKARQHCFRGDVIQMVVSREFSQGFRGDDFNVYRELRSINPSPYQFYFDYGDFRLFGCSPEAQLVIHQGTASVHPIAGTYRRSGDDAIDSVMEAALLEDAKENAEHVMLVDLARNDLSKNCSQVNVTAYKEVQRFSHVIHLVSEVQAKGATDNAYALKIAADTFPAGTLSGAPKYKALQLIDQYERGARSFYGGCIGFLGFDGDFNQAIMIRTFLSRGNTLFYQAGAGVVAASDEVSEMEEVHNKLRALRIAIERAKTPSYEHTVA